MRQATDKLKGNLNQFYKKKGATMFSAIVYTCNSCIHPKQSQLCTKPFLGPRNRNAVQKLNLRKKLFGVFAVSKGSAESSKSEETIPSWAKPDTDEPPPWARGEGKDNVPQEGFEVPFFVYLLASAITAIAAIGSIFEYVNEKPIFGVINSDSIFYAPILGFFAFTGIPTAAFLWFKSVQTANKEAEEQDRRDGYK